MPVVPFSAIVTQTANPTSVLVVPNKAGIMWVIPQFSVAIIPQRNTANCTVNLNGQYVTSAAFLPLSASGPPAITLQYFDVLSFDFKGGSVGDNVVVTLMYNEAPWGYMPRSDLV